MGMLLMDIEKELARHRHGQSAPVGADSGKAVDVVATPNWYWGPHQLVLPPYQLVHGFQLYPRVNSLWGSTSWCYPHSLFSPDQLVGKSGKTFSSFDERMKRSRHLALPLSPTGDEGGRKVMSRPRQLAGSGMLLLLSLQR